MAKAAKKNVTTAVLDKGTRYDELKTMLDERRRVILQEVQGRIRGVRAEGADKPHESAGSGRNRRSRHPGRHRVRAHPDEGRDAQQDQRGAGPARRGALRHCYECGDEIAEARLRALPFAVRCKDCEEERETAIQRERTMSRRGSSSFFDLQR